MNDWGHSSKWRKRGNSFLIEVSRHDVESPPEHYDEGPHRWAIYAYIYPSHPLFQEFDPDGGMLQDQAFSLNMHGAPSFFHVHRADEEDKDKITAYQVGCDYNHLHDGCYTLMGDDTFDTSSFKFDAEELFDHLQRLSAPTQQESA